MGRATTLLEKLCDHVRSFGGESIEVEREDDSERVYARKGNTGFSIANFKSSSEDGKELRKNLYAAAKKPVRAVVWGDLSLIKVRVFDNFGEDAFDVSIEPVPKNDPSVAPSFTAKQGQYLAFIFHYSKVHRQAPAEADLQEYFQVSPPSVHEMIKTLERNGLIARVPGKARSIQLLVRAEDLPALK